MSMTADLRDCFKAADVAGGKVYRDLRPQGSSLPAVTLQLVSETRDALMKDEQALVSSRVQVDCWAASRGEADALRDAVLAARPLRQTIGSTNFRRLYAEDGGTTVSDSAGGSAAATSITFRSRTDFIVWWRPA